MKAVPSKMNLGFLIAAAILSSMPTFAAKGRAPLRLSIATHTAEHRGFDVNSHLICGHRRCILVDAQFTRSEATKVGELIHQMKKKLKLIFITQAQPDHYLGAATIRERFPHAKVVSTPAIIEEIQKTAADKIVYWKPIYKNDLPSKFITPEEVTKKDLKLEGSQIELIEFPDQQAQDSAVLYLPENKARRARSMPLHR